MASKTPVKASDAWRTREVIENFNPNLASGSPWTKSVSRKPPILSSNADADADADGKLSSRAEAEMTTAQVVLPTRNNEESGLKVEVSESGRPIKRGKVMNLIQAFERILTLPTKEEEEEDCTSDDAPLLESPERTQTQSSSPCQLPEKLHLDATGSLSQESISRTSSGGRRRRSHSSESAGTSGVTRSNKKKLRKTNQKPFKLRTEQRGKVKEVELLCKIQQMVEEQERKRLRVAQGLPWTTNEPQCLVRPPVKEITRPEDVKLHTDMRAVERAEFNHQVAEKMSSFEQYKMEKVRQEKLAAEEEIRRLRKELVPKAQPMPYFDRPFVPIRESKIRNKKNQISGATTLEDGILGK